MIVYSETAQNFIKDVKSKIIAHKIKDLCLKKNINAGSTSEYMSWLNSSEFMKNVILNARIPDDVIIAMEYKIPQTAMRVDFIISGSDGENNNIIIVELKQWEEAEFVSDDIEHSVKTYTGKGLRLVPHPSYQAYSYAQLISNTSEVVQKNNIRIFPTAYLHNFRSDKRNQLDNIVFEKWIKKAPFFIGEDDAKLSKFINKYIKFKSKDDKLLNKIDNGRLKPSKSLQDAIVSMMKGNQDFLLIDDQISIFDECFRTMKLCKKDGMKRTLIIQGGPGTGKSVLAINLLKKFIKSGMMAQYLTKNAAPRNVFAKLLSKSDIHNKTHIKSLFRSPFGINKVPKNKIDAIIVDEAHRLVKKMYGDWQGENQIKEIINASLLSIFLIDEDQRITTKDIGTIDSIIKSANSLDSIVHLGDNLMLKSQFRCNGSDGYIQLIKNILQIGDNFEIFPEELNFDLRVFDDPNEMREELRKINFSEKHYNKARMVAGYCYPWNIKNKRGFDYDIKLKNEFYAKWNLPDDKLFAINTKSFEQVGCIHTAQGLEFDYVGVIIGNDLRYDKENNIVLTDQTMIHKDDKTSGIRTAEPQIAHKLILNTYKTLLTRGQKGCFLYCENDDLKEYIKQMIRR